VPLVRRVREAMPGVRVVNAYGQSETFYATTFSAEGSDGWAGTGSTPIGAPIGNMRAYVLGPGLMPVAPGVVGELYIDDPQQLDVFAATLASAIAEPRATG